MGRSGTHFVLLHGAQHGAWSWYKTKFLLESAGHRVTAVDLTSAGISAVNADEVNSFDQYNQPLCDVLDSLTNTDKIVLVGHSYGGLSVARATKRYASKVHVAVYVAACMLCSEQPMSEVWPQVFKEFGNDVRFSFGRGTGMAPTSTWVVEETAGRTYFGSCAPEDVELGMMLLRLTPCLSDDATTFTEKGYHSVPLVTLLNCVLPRSCTAISCKSLPLTLPRLIDRLASFRNPRSLNSLYREFHHGAFDH